MSRRSVTAAVTDRLATFREPAKISGSGQPQVFEREDSVIARHPSVLQRAAELCNARFGPARWGAVAPGRVNLIGEHVDYCQGLVMPVTTQQLTAIAATGPANPSTTDAVVFSRQFDQTRSVSLSQQIRPGVSGWPAWVEGVLAGFQQLGFTIPPFAAVIDSEVSPGGGLASSAALAVALATLLESILGTRLDVLDKARVCQQAEQQFAGVSCGMMDPISSVCGRRGHAMLLDCESLEMQWIPWLADDACLLVANTNVRHDLADGQYALRRQQCASAAQALGIDSLRRATRRDVNVSHGRMDETLWRRMRHVVNENERVQQAVDCLRQTDWIALGKLMYASHDSLRDDFEVSCQELDAMVGIARDIGIAGGVYGCRLTGGGFGGCTVWLVDSSRADSVESTICREYLSKTGIEPTTFICRAADGCRQIHIGDSA